MYELKRLSDWIKSSLSPDKLKQDPASIQQLSQWHDFLFSERKLISDNFLTTAAETINSSEIEQYIQNNQKVIIILSEVLFDYSYKSGKDLPNDVLKFYDLISYELDNILEELHIYYSKYFDLTLPVTHTFGEVKRKLIFKLYRGIGKLLKNPDIDNELFDLILKGVRDFINQRQRSITYHTVEYYERLIKTFSDLKPEDAIKDSDCRIHELLLTLNYNDPDYVHYYAGLIRSVIGIFGNINYKMEKLYWYRKVIRQQPIQSGAIYLIGMPPLSNQLSSWIDEELAYWQSMRQIINKNDYSFNGNPKLSDKIRLSLSVSELSTLVSAFFKLGVIKKMKYMEVLRVIAETYATTGTDEISINSLRAKSYANDPVARQNIRNLLLQAVELLSKQSS